MHAAQLELEEVARRPADREAFDLDLGRRALLGFEHDLREHAQVRSELRCEEQVELAEREAAGAAVVAVDQVHVAEAP